MRIEAFPTLPVSGLLGGATASGRAALRSPGVSLHYQARGAIYRLARALGFRPADEALVPAYHCGVEVQALEHAGAVVRYYRVDRALQADVHDLASRMTARTRLVVATRYFGLPQRLDEIAALCGERGVHFLEDRAHMLYDGSAEPPPGQLRSAVYSLPKLLPVPDGAVLVGGPRGAGDSLPRPPDLPVLRRVGLLALGRLRASHARTSRALEGSLRLALRAARRAAGARGARSPEDVLGRLDPGAERFEPGAADLGMSSWARRVLERTDLDAVRLRRQANAAALHARMRGAPGFRPVVDPLPPGAVPMFYPVWAPERGRLQGELAARGIGTFVFGGHLAEGLPAREFPEAGDLSAHVLGIPVHQDMDDKAVDHLVGGLMACLHT